MRTDDLVSILTHAAAVSQSAYCRKPLRRFLRFTREASLSDRVLKPWHPSDSASDGSLDRPSDRCSVCLGRSRHRFIRPGVIPTSTSPHGQALLGPQGIGQAGSDNLKCAAARSWALPASPATVRTNCFQRCPANVSLPRAAPLSSTARRPACSAATGVGDSLSRRLDIRIFVALGDPESIGNLSNSMTSGVRIVLAIPKRSGRRLVLNVSCRQTYRSGLTGILRFRGRA